MVFSDFTESTIQAYQAIVDGGPLNWLLLSSENDLDQVIQAGTGTQGLDELKSKADDGVFFAFLREHINDKRCFVFVVHIPESVSGVRRARAVVQSRRVGSLFKAQHVTLTVNNLDQLTTEAVHSALVDGIAARSSLMRSPNTSISKTLPGSPATEDSPMVRSISESTPQSSATPVTPTKIPTTSRSNVFSNFLRKRRPSETPTTPTPDQFAPAPPPKDGKKLPPLNFAVHPKFAPTPLETSDLHVSTDRGASDYVPSIPSPTSAEFEYVPEPHRLSPWKELAEDEDPPSSPTPQQRKGAGSPKSHPSAIFDPQERARRRVEAQRQKAAEEMRAMEEEAERQEQLRLEKQRILEEEEREDERRRAIAAAEARRVAEIRAKRSREVSEAEEKKRREMQERKEAEKERRRDESRKSEEWRREQARQVEEAAKHKEEIQKRAEEERKAEIRAAESKIKSAKTEALRVGWLTVQTNESLTWRRRFYKVRGVEMCFYRSPKDMHQVVDRLDLRGVKALKEWNEGYEDLEAIPHSFAVEFKDGQGAWAIYADTREEKVKLLGLIHQAAGLKT